RSRKNRLRRLPPSQTRQRSQRRRRRKRLHRKNRPKRRRKSGGSSSVVPSEAKHLQILAEFALSMRSVASVGMTQRRPQADNRLRSTASSIKKFDAAAGVST